jgi:hypothetical protein
MFKKSFNAAPNESMSVVLDPQFAVAASNPQTITPQNFNPSAANNYLSLGTITMPSGLIRLEGTSVWKII